MREERSNLPTLTEVFPSSSDALLPPPALLVMLMRLFVLEGRIMALAGRCGTGEVGGELAIAQCRSLLQQNDGIAATV